MPPVIEWSEQEIRALVDERKRRNAEYHRMIGRSKVTFWNDVAEQIKEDTGTNFTGIQCREKFKNVVKDCKVSKIFIIFIMFILGEM